MDSLLWKALLISAFCATEAAAQSSYDLRSPDGRIEVRIRTAKGLRYDVLLKGKALLEDSSASLNVDHKSLGTEAKVLHSKESNSDRVLVPVVRQKFAKIRENYRELRLEMAGGYVVAFRAYNEGVAYRFETSLPQPQVKVFAEEANFNFPSDFITYYGQEDSFFSHNERRYVPQHLTEIAPAFIATLSDSCEGFASSQVNSFGDQVAVFFRDAQSADYIAVTTGTRTFPWRVMMFFNGSDPSEQRH